MQQATREQFFRGLKAGVPVMFGFIPVAIAYALSARQAGFSALETILMSLMVYAGASQMMAVGMLSTGSAMGPIVLATFLLNLRHFIMSTYVMRELPACRSACSPRFASPTRALRCSPRRRTKTGRCRFLRGLR